MEDCPIWDPGRGLKGARCPLGEQYVEWQMFDLNYIPLEVKERNDGGWEEGQKMGKEVRKRETKQSPQD